MAVKLPENNRHWTTNWEFRVSDKPPTTNVYAGHGDFSGTTNEKRADIYCDRGGAEGHVVANKVKNALSQFAIPANVSFRPQPGPIPDRPEAPQLMPPTSAIPSPDYNCDNGFAVITRRPAPVQNAFAFIAEGHQVCLYNFKNGVKAYVLFYSVKKMESLTAGLFNGITRAIRGTDEERAQNQLMESIEDIRKEIPYLLVERIEIPGAPIQTPDAEAVAALVPPPRMEVAAGNGTGASVLGDILN